MIRFQYDVISGKYPGPGVHASYANSYQIESGMSTKTIKTCVIVQHTSD